MATEYVSTSKQKIFRQKDIVQNSGNVTTARSQVLSEEYGANHKVIIEFHGDGTQTVLYGTVDSTGARRKKSSNECIEMDYYSGDLFLQLESGAPVPYVVWIWK